ncbi:putative ribonuclease H-like domain-containing protein [Tanacetum coccineum]
MLISFPSLAYLVSQSALISSVIDFNQQSSPAVLSPSTVLMEPKKVNQALDDESWVEAMQEELLQNKKDHRGIMVRNKARLVAQGHRQEEGIDYDEVFAPVARIEAIRLFLAYASYMDFTVYQMDVKSAFLYGTIEEEVYVNQPPGFEDPEFPIKVYKVEKALYGLHQAPKAWYETLSTYLLENGFRRGTIDKTLFIKKIKNDILLVQVYIDDKFEGYGPKTSKSASEDISNEVRKSNDAPLVEKLVSDDKSEKKIVFPTVAKIEFVKSKQQEKPVRKPVKYAEMYRSQKPRGNQRNWNNQKSQQLGNDFVMHNKACYVCGSFDHLQYTCKQKRQLNGQREEKPVWNNARRVNHQNSPRITHPNPKRHMVPRKILTRSGPISLNTARQSHFNAVRTNRVNAVKASACWVWRPIKPNSASITLKRYDYVDGNPETELEDSVRLNSPEDKKSMTEDINADLETRYAKEGNKINIIDGVMICFKEKI